MQYTRISAYMPFIHINTPGEKLMVSRVALYSSITVKYHPMSAL